MQETQETDKETVIMGEARREHIHVGPANFAAVAPTFADRPFLQQWQI